MALVLLELFLPDIKLLDVLSRQHQNPRATTWRTTDLTNPLHLFNTVPHKLLLGRFVLQFKPLFLQRANLCRNEDALGVTPEVIGMRLSSAMGYLLDVPIEFNQCRGYNILYDYIITFDDTR